jgi:hypothetical protein
MPARHSNTAALRAVVAAARRAAGEAIPAITLADVSIFAKAREPMRAGVDLDCSARAMRCSTVRLYRKSSSFLRGCRFQGFASNLYPVLYECTVRIPNNLNFQESRRCWRNQKTRAALARHTRRRIRASERRTPREPPHHRSWFSPPRRRSRCRGA